ncbi:MAG: protein translocase SEC61 complex subunit gamma [Candidatus Nanoarchaeia archaeon]
MEFEQKQNLDKNLNNNQNNNQNQAETKEIKETEEIKETTPEIQTSETSEISNQKTEIETKTEEAEKKDVEKKPIVNLPKLNLTKLNLKLPKPSKLSFSALKAKLQEYGRVLRVAKKPSKEELQTIIKASGIGMLLIGFIGFIIALVAQLVGR